MHAMPTVRTRRLVHARAIVLVDAQHAFDAADDAAYCGTDHRADRTCDASALMEAMRGTSWHALRLCRDRKRDRCEKQA
jgi:hypothetical protein